MQKKINREELLTLLQDMEPGLAKRKMLEQSDCYIFEKGSVKTFNDQIACQGKCKSMSHVTGAVPAGRLLAILSKMSDETVEVEQRDDGVHFKGKGKGLRMNVQASIELDTSGVEKPSKWHALPDSFADAIQLVGACIGTDESEFKHTCIHLTPTYIEATDRYQISRYEINLKHIPDSIMVRRDQLTAICQRGPVEYSCSESWMHFKTSGGMIMSARLHVDDYPDLSEHLDVEGTPTKLPKALTGAVERAEVFSGEDKNEDNLIKVEIRENRMRIQGEGVSGEFWEFKKVDYTGPDLAFFIDPKLLVRITQEYNECHVSNTAVKVEGSQFVFVTSLAKV